jgi:hypothetical protein
MHAVFLVLILAQGEPLPPPPPPPLPLPSGAAPEAYAPTPPPVRDENGVALLAQHPSRVRVSLTAEAPNAELYDVAALMTLCRAPCGVWLNTDETRRYQVKAPGVTESSEFSLNEFSGEVSIYFKHRNDVARALGLTATIIGGVGVIGGAALALGWLVVMGLVNLFTFAFGGRGYLGAFEFLYAAAIAALGGGAFLTPGLVLMLGIGRQRLDITQGPSTPLPAPAVP